MVVNVMNALFLRGEHKKYPEDATQYLSEHDHFQVKTNYFTPKYP